MNLLILKDGTLTIFIGIITTIFMQRNFRGIKFFGMLTLICGIILICLYDSGKFPSWGTNIPIPNSNGNYCDVLIEESHENIIFGDVLIMGAQIIAGFRLIYQQAID